MRWAQRPALFNHTILVLEDYIKRLKSKAQFYTSVLFYSIDSGNNAGKSGQTPLTLMGSNQVSVFLTALEMPGYVMAILTETLIANVSMLKQKVFVFDCSLASLQL